MTQTFLLISTILFSLAIHSQTLMESALKDRSNIVLKKPINIDLKNYKFESAEFFNYLDLLKAKFSKNDTTELKELIAKTISSEADLTEWHENEIPNRILVRPKEFVRPKVGLEKIKWTTEAEKKAIKKEIREYNNNSKYWPRFPVSISRPVYSESGNYAIIGLINGGSSGNISLYRKTEKSWTLIVDLKSWVY